MRAGAKQKRSIYSRESLCYFYSPFSCFPFSLQYSSPSPSLSSPHQLVVYGSRRCSFLPLCRRLLLPLSGPLPLPHYFHSLPFSLLSSHQNDCQSHLSPCSCWLLEVQRVPVYGLMMTYHPSFSLHYYLLFHD